MQTFRNRADYLTKYEEVMPLGYVFGLDASKTSKLIRVYQNVYVNKKRSADQLKIFKHIEDSRENNEIIYDTVNSWLIEDLFQQWFNNNLNPWSISLKSEIPRIDMLTKSLEIKESPYFDLKQNGSEIGTVYLRFFEQNYSSYKTSVHMFEKLKEEGGLMVFLLFPTDSIAILNPRNPAHEALMTRDKSYNKQANPYLRVSRHDIKKIAKPLQGNFQEIIDFIEKQYKK